MGMEMVPYTARSSSDSGLAIDPAVVQNMGVQTARVTAGPLHTTIRAVGLFKLPESGLHEVSLKIGGWVDRLYADQEGMHIHKGEPLFALYSPDLQVAEQELISAVASRHALEAQGSAALRQEADQMIASARRKLQLWDINKQDIDAIAQADRPPRDIVFRSLATGHLEDKMIVQGSAIQAGTKLLTLADHSTMWLEAQVYESQMALIRMGQKVKVAVDAIPGKTFTGKVSFIYPHVDHMTRTLMVRAVFENPNLDLKPGMYAQASILIPSVTDAIQVPQEAVMDTGTRQFVFVADDPGLFIPRTVRVGVKSDDGRVQIVEGLAAGETVVTSGQFLMDVESRTREAFAKLGARLNASKPAATGPTAQP